MAIKFLQTSNGDAFRRFTREVKVLWHNLTNPYVVTLIDHDLDGPWPYLVMEYCIGGSLRGWVADRRSWQEVAAALVQVAHGLTAFHQSGGAHRDIKPDNLLLTKCPDGHWVVKVGNFGLARSPDLVSDCMTYSPCGTPGYLAPEVQGGQPYTPAVDIYSLGITGIELLASGRDRAALEGAAAPRALLELLRCMTASLAADRPSVEEVERQLRELLSLAPAAPQRSLAAKWYPWIITGTTGLAVAAASGLVLWVNRGALMRSTLDFGLAALGPAK